MKKLLSLLSFAIVASVNAKEITFKIGDNVKTKFPNAEFKLLVACGSMSTDNINTTTVAIGRDGLKYDPVALCTFLNQPLLFANIAFVEKADFGRLYSIFTLKGESIQNYSSAMTIKMREILKGEDNKAKDSLNDIKTPQDTVDTFTIISN